MSTIKANGVPDFNALYPRLLHFGVAYGDLMQVSAKPYDWVDWGRSLALQARQYEAGAEEAWLKGQKATAVERWRRAVDYFHFAQLRLADSDDKWEFQARCRQNYAKLAPLMEPEALRWEVPFKSARLPGYFRLARPGAPCVILIGGLDSEKEVELHYFAEYFLRRGLSVFFFDHPGQGELCRRLALTTNSEAAVSTIIDRLTEEPMVDGQRLGLFGVSFGGYLACRAAASDRRVSACICLGGFFNAKIFERLSPLAVATFKRTFGLNETENLGAIAPQITLETLRGRMDRPLFIVHGRDDYLIDEDQIITLRDWACGPKKVWIVDGAEHVCTNRFSECLPVVGDWMSEQLTSMSSVRDSHTESELGYDEAVH